MPTKPWKDLEGHYFRIDVGSTAATAMQGDPYTIYYTTEGYIVLNGEMMGRTITNDSSPTQVIDLAALDPNTWYPVTCILPENLPTNVLTIHHALQGWDGPIPPWASHRLGFFAFMRVTCNPSDWGANNGYVVITHNRYNFIVNNFAPVRYKCMSTTRYTERSHSVAIFYLRGGTTYHGSIQIGNDLEIEKQYLAPWAVHPDGFTDKGSNETYLPISDTSKLPANIPDVPARLDTLESTVKTKADASAVYDRATVDQKITDKANELSRSIGNKVDATAYLQKVDELEKKDGQLNTAIGQQAKRIDKVQDVGIVAFTDLEASVTNIQQASVSLNFAICYAEMQNVFVAKTIENGVAKYYNNWPTAEMYNKDGVARADKLYMRFTNGTMVPYAYHPVMRKLVAIPAGMTSGTDSLENCIKKLETKDGELSTLIGRKADASSVYDRATVDRLHQDVVKTSQLPEVYEQASLYGVLTVEHTVTLPPYAREVHVRQTGAMTLGISTDTASLSNSRGLYIYIEGHEGSVRLATPAPVWFLNSDGAIAQSKRFKMTFGAACCLTYREGSFTLIPLSPVPITPA